MFFFCTLTYTYVIFNEIFFLEFLIVIVVNYVYYFTWYFASIFF